MWITLPGLWWRWIKQTRKQTNKQTKSHCEPTAYCSGLSLNKKFDKIGSVAHHVTTFPLLGSIKFLFVSFRDRVLLCSLGWPGPHRGASPGWFWTCDPPASASHNWDDGCMPATLEILRCFFIRQERESWMWHFIKMLALAGFVFFSLTATRKGSPFEFWFFFMLS